MRNLTRLLLLVFIVSSCAVNQDVTNGSWIQKRKYTKGFHLSNKSDNSRKNKVDKKDDVEEHIADNSDAKNETTFKNNRIETDSKVDKKIKESDEGNNELIAQTKLEKTKNTKSIKDTPNIDDHSEATASAKEDSEIENNSTSFRERMIEKYESIYGVSDNKDNKLSQGVLLVLGIVLCIIALSPLGVLIVKGSGGNFTLNLIIWLIAIALFVLLEVIGFGLYGALGGLVMLVAIVHGILAILDVI